MSADLHAHAGLEGGPIYLDYNATTPVDPRVIEAMLPYLTTYFGNPSSSHHYAEQPRRALATARRQVARLIGAAPDEIVFTGSGSEADALAIHGTVMAHRRPSDVQVITQVTEHPAVLEACRALHRRHGTEVTYLPVGPDGRVKPHALLRMRQSAHGGWCLLPSGYTIFQRRLEGVDSGHAEGSAV